MRWQEIWAIARAEMRLTRRLVRYWAFLAIAYLIGLGGWLYYAVLHGFFSSYSATVSQINPRYLLGALGTYYLIVFLVGLLFLGFDVRARDVRERMVEVLDARPVSNLELLAGRFVGVIIMSGLPVVAIAALMQALGLLLRAVGAPLGSTMNLMSLVGFVGPMAVPAFAFALALTYLVSVVVRNRLVSAVILLVVLGLLLVGLWWVPLVYTPLADISGQLGAEFPSDVLPTIATWDGWLQRFGVLVAALGLLVLAAALYPGWTEGRGAGGWRSAADAGGGHGVPRRVHRGPSPQPAHARSLGGGSYGPGGGSTPGHAVHHRLGGDHSRASARAGSGARAGRTGGRDAALGAVLLQPGSRGALGADGRRPDA